MKWKIKKIYNFASDNYWCDGYTQFGFHDYEGNNYVLQNEKHWIGQLTKTNSFLWTAGSFNPKLSEEHFHFNLKNPIFLSKSYLDDSLLVSSSGNKHIYKIFPVEEKIELFLDATKYGLRDIGNCVTDKEGNIWINEITGYRLWQFDLNGEKKLVLGTGEPGFQKKVVKFSEARFNWIYDIRLGPDNNLYVLDSRNFVVRMLDLSNHTVELIAGNGKPGYSGDGGLAIDASFGSKADERFDGPWSLSLDEDGNIFIGDTQNHVVRMVDRKTGIISTIAGNKDCIASKRNSPSETDLYQLNFPKICSMDYFNKELFIPEWDGDLVILEKIH